MATNGVDLGIYKMKGVDLTQIHKFEHFIDINLRKNDVYIELFVSRSNEETYCI